MKRSITFSESQTGPSVFLLCKCPVADSSLRGSWRGKASPGWGPGQRLHGDPVGGWQWCAVRAPQLTTPGLLSAKSGAGASSGQALPLLESYCHNSWGPLLSCSCMEGLPCRTKCLRPCPCVTGSERQRKPVKIVNSCCLSLRGQGNGNSSPNPNLASGYCNLKAKRSTTC